MKKQSIAPLLLMGMFSFTQIRIGGNIGISELIACLICPILFIVNFQKIRHDGFLPLVSLAALCILGCFIAGWVNNTDFMRLSKGLAATYTFFSGIVVFHFLLRDRLDGVKWALLGFAISVVINAFYFHYGAEGGLSVTEGATGADAAANMAKNNTLFWASRLEHWLFLPIRGWYLSTPLAYTILAPLGLVVFSIFVTASGRSLALVSLISVFLSVVGGKSVRKMQRISRGFWLYLILALVIALAFKSFYMNLGKHGKLSEAQLRKYESQTSGGTKTGTLQFLMSGRVEFFVGLMAAFRRPILGYGPWPIDEDGIYFEFLEKYGNVEDFEVFDKVRQRQRGSGRFMWLPSHSIIIEFWQWFGIFGLLLWLYIVWNIYLYFRRYLTCVPQWFGFLALYTPTAIWHIFFSPFGGRIFWSFFIVILFLNKAIAVGKLRLPPDMEFEKWNHR